MSIFSIAVMIIVFLLFISLIGVSIGAYVIQALALSTVARLEGKQEILAWIPFANIYLLFELTDTIPYLVLLVLCSAFGTIGNIIVAGFAIFVLLKVAALCQRYGIDVTLVYVGMIVPLVALIPIFQLYKEAKSRLESYS